MDISKASFTVVALILGAALLVVGIIGEFSVASATIMVTEDWSRIALIAIGSLIVGASLYIELGRRTKSDKQGVPGDVSKTSDETESAEESTLVSLFALDDDASHNFSEIAADARRVSVLSRTAVNLLGQYFREFEALMDNGGSVRILIVDPDSEVCKWIYGGAPEIFAKNVSAIRHHVERLSKKGGHRFEVRKMAHVPTFSLLWSEKQQTAQDALYVQFYFLHGPGNRQRPTIALSGKSRWIPVFVDEFDKIWAEARPWDATADTPDLGQAGE